MVNEMVGKGALEVKGETFLSLHPCFTFSYLHFCSKNLFFKKIIIILEFGINTILRINSVKTLFLFACLDLPKF